MKKRDIFIGLGAILLAFVLAMLQLYDPAVTTGAWGLSYNTEIPQGPASAQQLYKYDAAYVGDTSQKVLYLTFDAGYENGQTEKILDILKKQQVPATFFLVGNYIQRNPELVRRMVAEGHMVANHTMHHPDMSKISTEEAFEKELRDLEALYLETVGSEMPKYYRPPQGVYSEENLKMAKKLGYKTVFWSLAYADWDNNNQPTRQQAFDKLLPRTHNGAVILLHSTSQTNGAILEELLTRWKEMGYEFRPIDALYGPDM